MASAPPRHVICVLGQWKDFDRVEAVVRDVGGAGFRLDREFSQLSPDARMTRAFQASCDRVFPSMTDEDWEAVRGHSAVAYVLSPPLLKGHAQDVSGLALRLIAALLRDGGAAAKGESSGIAHGRARWLESSKRHGEAGQAGDRHEQAATLYGAWVRRPLLDRQTGVLYSCGMHLLGERDVEIDSSLDPQTAIEWLDLLALYLLADENRRPVEDGDGFRLRDPGPRRVVRLQPCSRYDADDFFHNPYGYIRLSPGAS